MATSRKPRSPKTPSAAAAAEHIDVESKFVDEPASAWQCLKDAMPKLEDGWQRQAIGLVLGIITSAGIGAAFGAALGYMLIGAAACGVNTFLQFAMYLIGVFITLWCGSVGGTVVATAVHNHTIEKAGIAAYNYARSFFTQPQGVSA